MCALQFASQMEIKSLGIDAEQEVLEEKVTELHKMIDEKLK